MDTLRFGLGLVAELVPLFFIIISTIVYLAVEALTPARIQALLAGRSGWVGVLLAAMLGAVTPFCSCSTVPLVNGMRRAGIPLMITITFLIASPLINPLAVGLLWTAVGAQYAALYTIAALLLAMGGAVTVARWYAEPAASLLQRRSTLTVVPSAENSGGVCGFGRAVRLRLSVAGGIMRTRALLLIALGVFAAAPSLPAQQVASAPTIASRPVLDGVMQPNEWAGAALYSNLIQTEPAEGAPLSERTEVWLARDAAHLYVAFVAYDDDMRKIRADLTPRDRAAATSDLVGVLLDPLHTGTRGYFFLFNPLGVQTDGVWTRSPDISWDGVLESRGRVEADRYVVEAAIPLATVLSVGQAADAWDINFFRQIPRKGEEGWWSPVPRDGTQNTMLHAGRLTGMADVHAGARLEVIPTALVQTRQNPARISSLEQTWGATTRLAIAPTVRAEATYRPDFSIVEADDAQISYNERYALYYPEKRPFFLEAKDRFETPAASMVSDPLLLVHTRTIARPRLGARLLAEPDGAFAGAVFAADETPDGRADGTSGIVRAQLVRAGGTQAGVLVTRRDRPDHTNTVAAVDGLLRLPANVVVTVQAARSMTTSDSALAGLAAYVDVARDARGSFQQIVFRKVARGFESDLGFIPRADLQQVVSHAGVYIRPRHSALLAITPMIQYVISFDDAGRRRDVEYLPHVSFKFTRQTSLWFGGRFGEEIYRAQAHPQARMEAQLSTLPAPWLNLSADAKLGSRIRYDDREAVADATFTGRFRELRASADLRVGKSTTVSASGLWRSLGGNDQLPARELWLARVRAAYQFNTTTYARLIAQYDPDRSRADASVLIGHEVSYGTQFHAGLDTGDADPSDVSSGAHYHVFARISYLFRR